MAAGVRSVQLASWPVEQSSVDMTIAHFGFVAETSTFSYNSVMLHKWRSVHRDLVDCDRRAIEVDGDVNLYAVVKPDGDWNAEV